MFHDISIFESDSASTEATHIAGTGDIGAVQSWLHRFQGSVHTVAAARKESERLLLWLMDKKLTLSSIKVEHLAAYVEFLQNPEPAEIWIGPPKPRLLKGAPNPNWRPFAGRLAATSIKQASTILFGLFEYLVAVNYLQANIWRLLQKKKVHRPKSIERYLPEQARDLLFQYVRKLARPTDTKESADYRSSWLISLFYLSGARRSEVAKARMSHLKKDNTGWWWKITGKGDKPDEVPLSPQFMAQLGTYRLSLGLPALPSPLETDIPLIGDTHTGRRPLSPSSVYKLVRKLCDQAARETEDPFIQEILQKASPHWIRHTTASDQLNEAGLGLITVSRNLRHSDIATTSRYTHVDRDQRYAETQKYVLPSETDPDEPE